MCSARKVDRASRVCWPLPAMALPRMSWGGLSVFFFFFYGLCGVSRVFLCCFFSLGSFHGFQFSFRAAWSSEGLE